jgi:ADP-heptose:LPS heptosyltransferase
MNSYLFFRTDRIGDFLMSSILLKSIKRNNPNSHITVVASNKNIFFIKKLNLVDEVIEYPSNPLKKAIFFLGLLKKRYHLTVALDGKKRSIFNSILCRSNIKVLITTKEIYKKFLGIFFSSIIYSGFYNSKIEEIKKILNILKFNFDEKDLNVFNGEEGLLDKKKILPGKFSVLHFDEKWITGKYRNDYTNIEPSIEELLLFLKQIVKCTDLNLVVSTGNFSNPIVEELKLIFTEFSKDDFRLVCNNKTIILLTNLPFIELGYVISKSSLIITCHGAFSHFASAFNIKIIDIFEEKEKFAYYKWNAHFRKYKFIYRTDFNVLSKTIINLL